MGDYQKALDFGISGQRVEAKLKEALGALIGRLNYDNDLIFTVC